MRSTCAGLSTILVVLALLAFPACREPGASVGPTPNVDPDTGLVECPGTTTQTSSQLITPLGGSVSVAGSSVTLPAGALTLPTLIALRVPASPYMEIQLTAGGLDAFVFELPVTVVLDYSRCTRAGLDTAAVRVWQIDAATKAKIADVGGTDSKASRTVTFTTGHFSSYALAY